MNGIADYVFIRHLGDGNHGSFWLARPPERLGVTAESVAVKVLGQRANEDDFRRMANELRIYSQVECADLVKILDAGHDDGRLFYTTRYHENGSLDRPSRPLDRRTVINAVASASRAAHELHEHGIAHRDIKPANILLDGEHGRLADLGLAQIINPGQTVTGVGPVGTIEFLSPEVIRGESATRASDIWALGVTLHNVLTGRPVYHGLRSATLLDALRQVLTDRPVIDSSLEGDERAIVERCLMPEPVDRFATAAELATELEGALR